MIDPIRVLVVDDYEDDRRLFCELLARRGCHVRGADGYGTALAVLCAESFDVAVLDLKMPGRSGVDSSEAGVDLLREIRRRGLGVGVIILTGRPTMESLRQTEQLGFSSYLVKEKLLGLVDPDVGADLLYREVVKAARQRVSPEEVERMLSLSDPLSLTYEAYQILDSRGAAVVQKKAREAKDAWAHEKLRAVGARWMVLCGNEVVCQSADLQELPRPEELDRIGKEHDRVPFLFIRLSDDE